jgi:S1-C subfamily serine protease
MSRVFKSIIAGLVIIILAFHAKKEEAINTKLSFIDQGQSIITYDLDVLNKNLLNTNNNVIEGTKATFELNKVMVKIMQAIDGNSVERDNQLTIQLNQLVASLAKEIKLNKIRDAYLAQVTNFILKQDRDQVMTQELFDREIEGVRKLIAQSEDAARLGKEVIEHNIMLCNIMLYNNEEGTQGSGITIKLQDKFYILSAAHLVSNDKQLLQLVENGLTICDVRVVRWDPKADLLLLETVDPDIQPRVWTTIAKNEAQKGVESIYVCGNPIGLEDVLSTARVIKYEGAFFYYLDHSYFGSSGGGIFNMAGELIGTISHLIAVDPTPAGIVTARSPMFVIHGACRTQSIHKFLEGLE